jgi:hypothetical protein
LGLQNNKYHAPHDYKKITKIKEENLMNKLNRKIDSIMNMLSGKIKAELKLQDATG